MAFDLNQFAADFGIDPATLTAKGDVAAKYNTYFQEADTRYAQATQAQKDAEAALNRVQTEQQAINDQIAKFGMTEANFTALKANNAQMEAALKAFKEQGFDVNIPALPTQPQPAEPQFDPNRFQNQVASSLAEAINVQNRYQRTFGNVLPDDIDVLAREAAQARKPLSQYAAEKYDFAGAEKKKNEAALAEQKAKWQAEAVAEYKEKNPITQGNPNLTPGVQSRAPQILKPREESERKQFSNMGFRQKISDSVARTRKVLEQQAS